MQKSAEYSYSPEFYICKYLDCSVTLIIVHISKKYCELSQTWNSPMHCVIITLLLPIPITISYMRQQKKPMIIKMARAKIPLQSDGKT